MPLSRYLLPAVLPTVLLAALAGCQSEDDGSAAGNGGSTTPQQNAMADAADEDTPAPQDMIGTLETNADYSTVVSAISASGLTERLSSDEPTTLFAPTNAAFDKLPASTLEQLMQLSEQETLSEILSMHVLGRALDSTAIAEAIAAGDGEATFRTLNGETLTARMDGDTIRLTGPGGNSARIVQADMAALNGIVHGIDTVLAPPEEEADDDSTDPGTSDAASEG